MILENIYTSNLREQISRLRKYALTIFLSSLLIPSTAFAYVDPGSGSVIITTVLGFIAAIGYTFRKYFYKIRRTILGKKQETREKDGT